MRLPRRIAQCPKCGTRFDADSDVLLFMGLGVLVGIFLALMFCQPAQAQEKPNNPKPKTDKVFWVGTVALAAAKTFDATETRTLLDRGGHENNPAFGRHPSAARQAGINAAFFAGQTVLFHFTEHSRNRYVRWLGRGYIAFTIEQHFRAGVCNAGISTQGPLRNCQVRP